MVLKCIIILTTVSMCNTQPTITHQEVKDYFSRRELANLEYLKDFVCGFSLSTQSTTQTKYEPFFCVPNDLCSTISTPPEMVVPLTNCTERPSAADTCCYMGFIGGDYTFNSSVKYWGVSNPKNTSIANYANLLYRDHVHHRYQGILDSNSLCGLTPALHTNPWGEQDIFYTPYFCRATKCDEDLATNVENYFALNQFVYPRLSKGDKFCNSKKKQGYCCHAITLMDEDFSDRYFNQIKHFYVRTMNPYQKSAFGFRSSFQCEQYSRLTCEGTYDRCSLRVLNRDTAVPGEFPHQALLGVQGPSFRHFHCSGTLVSRYYILSSFLCKYHNRIPTSIALLGEYDFHDRKEFGEREYFAYLDKVYVEPAFDLPTESPSESTREKFAFNRRLALFKMWRQVKFSPWVRPACINWKTLFKDGKDLTAVFPDNVTFTGYGTTEYGGRWNRTLKRYEIVPDACDVDTDNCRTCKSGYFERGHRWEPRENFCIVTSIDDLDNIKGPCQFDLGGSAVIHQFNHTPYCQWRVFGVSVVPKEDCKFAGPSLFRVIGGQLLAWLEEVIWYEDFSLPLFDMRWPPCEDKYEYAAYNTLLHLKRGYSSYYP